MGENVTTEGFLGDDVFDIFAIDSGEWSSMGFTSFQRSTMGIVDSYVQEGSSRVSTVTLSGG